MLETKGLGAGSYPEPPEIEEKTIKVKCSFETFIRVPIDWNYDKVEEYVRFEATPNELLYEVDQIDVDDIEF